MDTTPNTMPIPVEARPKKARQVRSNVKVLFIVFFDYNSMVYNEFLPEKVNKAYHQEVMQRFHESTRLKRSGL